ncbi:MAG: hypothetical protein ACO1RX_18585 [Candidatus Sericytochromatia bacterium]
MIEQTSERPGWDKRLVLVFNRCVAMLLDLSVFGMFWLGFSFLLPSNLPPWLGAGVACLLLTLSEALWRRTPGKICNGLLLQVEGGFWLRVLKVGVRNLGKGALFWGTVVWRLEELNFSPGFILAWPLYLGGLYSLVVLIFDLPVFQGFSLWLGQTKPTKREQKRVLRMSQSLVFALLFALGWGLLMRPNFTSGTDQRSEKTSSVKANMHTLQTMLETYAVDWGGVYPPSLNVLYQDAQIPNRAYWKELTNPYTAQRGLGKALQEDKRPPQAGMATYLPEPAAKGVITRYWIYGYSKHAKRIRDRSGDFYLTNSR